MTETLIQDKKVTYEYDAEGLRTSKTVNGKKTIYIWDGDQLAMEITESGKVIHRYVRGSSLIYSDKGAGTDKQYYVMNPHGDVVQLLDEDGNVTKSYEYDSFGNEINLDKKDDNPFRYAGEYYDKETDSIYLRARYYQPELGRFLTRDSYTGEDDDPLTLHLYTYCGNDAINNVDPSGHFFETILDIASIGYSVYSLVTEPSWENAAYLAWDVAATVVPGVPGFYVEKGAKAVSQIAKSSKAVQKGAKYAKRAKTAVSSAKAVKKAKTAASTAKTVGKKVLNKSSSALKKRVKLNGGKLATRTKNALDKAKKRFTRKTTSAARSTAKTTRSKAEILAENRYVIKPTRVFVMRP